MTKVGIDTSFTDIRCCTSVSVLVMLHSLGWQLKNFLCPYLLPLCDFGDSASEAWRIGGVMMQSECRDRVAMEGRGAGGVRWEAEGGRPETPDAVNSPANGNTNFNYKT